MTFRLVKPKPQARLSTRSTDFPQLKVVQTNNQKSTKQAKKWPEEHNRIDINHQRIHLADIAKFRGTTHPAWKPVGFIDAEFQGLDDFSYTVRLTPPQTSCA